MTTVAKTQHPRVALPPPPPSTSSLPRGCSAHTLLLLPPALFPDPSLVPGTVPRPESASSPSPSPRTRVAVESQWLEAPHRPNPVGWDSLELERAAGWSRDPPAHSHRDHGDDAGASSFVGAIDVESVIRAEAKRQVEKMYRQAAAHIVRRVSRTDPETGGRFQVLVSSERDEDEAEPGGARFRVGGTRDGGDGVGTDPSTSASRDVPGVARPGKARAAGGSSSSSGRYPDPSVDFAHEYRALLISHEAPLSEVQLHARYLPATPTSDPGSASTSAPAPSGWRPLLDSILFGASSSDGDGGGDGGGGLVEVTAPRPRSLWLCDASSTAEARDLGATQFPGPAEAVQRALFPSPGWSGFELPSPYDRRRDVLLAPGSPGLASVAPTSDAAAAGLPLRVLLPRPTLRHADEVLLATHLVSLLAALALCVSAASAVLRATRSGPRGGPGRASKLKTQ